MSLKKLFIFICSCFFLLKRQLRDAGVNGINFSLLGSSYFFLFIDSFHRFQTSEGLSFF